MGGPSLSRYNPRHGSVHRPGESCHEKKTAGSEALGDIGAHIIDPGRFLVGEMKSVSAMTRTFITERPLADGKGTGKVDVDDAFVAAVEFHNGAIGTLEASRFAAGRKNYQVLEINREKGSIRFNLERMNEMEVFWVGEEPKEAHALVKPKSRVKTRPTRAAREARLRVKKLRSAHKRLRGPAREE